MKKSLFLIWLFLLPVLMFAQKTNLNRGLVAYYSFDGNANDMSGNGNNGEIKGVTPTVDHLGTANKAYHFAGVDNPQVIRVPNSNSLKFNDAMSVSLWVKNESHKGMNGWGRTVNTENYQVIFAKDFDRGNLHAGINCDKNNNTRISLSNADVGVDAAFDFNKWQHVVFVVTNHEMKIYINGTLAANKAMTTNFNNANSKDLWFGRFRERWYPFCGSIDEVRIYNRELDQKEVSALFNNNIDDMVFIDKKLSDNDPKFKLFSYNIPSSAFAYSIAENTNKFYLFLSGSRTVVEFDLERSTKDNCVSRTFSLENDVAFRGSCMEVSSNSRYLAYVDDQDKALHIVDINTAKEVATYPLGKKYNNYDKGIVFQFVSNNEVLVAGAAKAALFNFSKNKAKTYNLKELKEEPTYKVLTTKIIAKRVGSYVLDNSNKIEYDVIRGDYETSCSYIKKIGSNKTITRKIDGAIVRDTYMDFNNFIAITRNREKKCIAISKNDFSRLISFPEMRHGIISKDYKYYILWGDNRMDFFNYTQLNAELEKQELLNAMEKKDVDAINDFIKSSSNIEYVAIAKRECRQMASNAFKSITSTSTSPSHVKELEDMIDTYKEGPAVDSAQTELANLYKSKYNSINKKDVFDLVSYIDNYPKSPYCEQAKASVNSIYKSKYDAVCRTNDSWAYRDYANNYPNSPYASAAKDAADRIDQQVAERQKAEQQRIEQEQRQAESQAMRETMSNSVGRYVTWTETAAYDISKGDEGLIGSLISNKLGLNTVKYIVKYTAIVKTVLGESLEVIISSAEIQKESWVSANWLKYKNYANTDVQKSVGQTRIKQFNEVSLK